MTFDLAQMIADRDAGTPGDFYVKSLRGYTEDYICTDHPDFQQSPHGNYVGETGLAAGHAKQRFEQDARRFARVPAMEAEIIRLTARVAELEAALKPLADMAERYDPDDGDDGQLECWSGLAVPKIHHLRTARAVLSTHTEEPKT